jgi:hypothetical protein
MSGSQQGKSLLRSVSAPHILGTPLRTQPSRSAKSKARLSLDSNLDLYYDPDADDDLTQDKAYTPRRNANRLDPKLDPRRPKDNQKVTFLTLPAEVRNMIYHLALPELPELVEFSLNNCDKNYLNKPRPTRATSLLRVCRQISTEAQLGLFVNTTFKFEINGRDTDYIRGQGLKARWTSAQGVRRLVDYSFLKYAPLQKVSLIHSYDETHIIEFFLDSFPTLKELVVSNGYIPDRYSSTYGEDIQYTGREFAISKEVRAALYGEMLNGYEEHGTTEASRYLKRECEEWDQLYAVAQRYRREWDRQGRAERPNIRIIGRLPAGWEVAPRESKVS